MTKAVPSRPWFAAWRTPARPTPDDPADMGTAFGLELSLHESAQEPSPAAARPPGWVRRRIGRRKVQP